MKIPEDKNTRAEEMWRPISQNVDFRNKNVVDLGCGHGDMLWRVYIAGANMVTGLDEESLAKTNYDGINIYFHQGDIEAIIKDAKKDLNILNNDIAMCFSVLPYLDDIPATIKWMAENFDLSLIEAQYDSEPFNVGVVSDRGMAQLLLNNGFSDVEPIGKSYVDYRKVYRTIWRCE